MTRKNAFYDTNALYINAALIAGHANNHQAIFRQKDIKFFIELMTNWMETSFEDHCLNVQNTQVQRLLDQLTSEGILKKITQNQHPAYEFTSIGVLEIINRLVSDKSLEDNQSFFFLYHFVSLYSDKMQDLLFKRQSLPQSYKLEIKHLLDPKNLVERQIRRVRFKIEKLRIRIKEAHAMSKISVEMIKKEKSLTEIIKRIETSYPYQLNNQRKMSELFKTLTPDVQYLEITEAPKMRANTLWEPVLRNYENYLAELKLLQSN